MEFEDETVQLEDLRLISAGDRDPAAAAHQMADQLRSTPREEWLREFNANS